MGPNSGAFSGGKENWIYQGSYQDLSDGELYLTAVYFTVTTIVTVGYGDVSAHNSGEKGFCIFLMLLGVVSFSFATGSVASIIASLD